MGFLVSSLFFFLVCCVGFPSGALRIRDGFVPGRDSLDRFAEGGEGKDFETVRVDDCEGGAEDIGEIVGERGGGCG